jgi:hypothetical protein
MEVVARSTPKPTATPDPDPDPGDGNGGRSRTRIADAAEGDTVTIVGTVTSQAGLIDGEGRRVTVEDPSGAILVRYPDGASVPGVGWVIRARGEVGTWYGGRQLEAEEAPQRIRQGRARPTILRRPPADSDEWQLVSVTVRLLDVQRDGDTWRAEATLGAAGELPITGLASSGIVADGLEEGRSARVTGIVKRAHPSATDQRFAIAPRSAADIELGRVVPGEAGGEDGAGTGRSPGDPHGGPSDTSTRTTTIGSLDDLAGALVRVGGRVVGVAADGFTLDDGTGRLSVRLAEGAGFLEPPLLVDDVVNVVGRVRATRAGGIELLARSTSDILTAAAMPSDRPGAEDPDRALLSASVAGPTGLDSSPPAAGAGPSSGLPVLPLMAALLGGLSLLLLAAGVLLVRWPTLVPRLRRRLGRSGSRQVPDEPGSASDGMRCGHDVGTTPA